MKQRKLQKFFIVLLILFFTIEGFCQMKLAGKNNSVIIPIDLSSHRPILELMINGKGPYKFIFDTGSSSNIIDLELSDKLGLEIVGEDSLESPGSEKKLISKRVLAKNVTLSGNDIRGKVFMNTMSIRKMVSVDGILSPDVLADYLVAIDYPNSKIILETGELNTADTDVTSFIQKDNIINFNVFIGGNKLAAHLDSGNPGGIDIPYSLKDKLYFKDGPSENGFINTPSASFKKWKAALAEDIKIGNMIYKNPNVNLVEGFRFVNLGYRIIKDLKITIDKKNNLIKFEKSSATIHKEDNEVQKKEKNEYTGWYGNHARKIFVDNGEMYLQRGDGPKLKLVKIGKDKFEMAFNMPVKNELPMIRFERDEVNNVAGLTFVFKNGKEDFVVKDE